MSSNMHRLHAGMEAPVASAKEVFVKAAELRVQRHLEGHFGHLERWFFVRTDLFSSCYNIDLRISVHGPFVSAARAESMASRTLGRTWVLGPFSRGAA